MQYYIPAQDVLGSFSDELSNFNYLFDGQKHSELDEKLFSTFSSKLDTNQFKSNLDKNLERIKQKIQMQNENNISKQLQSKQSNISKQNETLKVIEKIESFTQTENIQSDIINMQNNTEVYIENKKQINKNQLKLFRQEIQLQIQPHKIKQKFSDFQCQIDQFQEESQYKLLNQNFENNSQLLQYSCHSSDLIDNLQIIHDQINEQSLKCICGKSNSIKQIKLVDVECQYDAQRSVLQSMNNLEAEIEENFKNIKSRSRCMSQIKQTQEGVQINDDYQITFLEDELLLKNELLETTKQVIFKLHSQIKDLHKLINDEKDGAINLSHLDLDQSNQSYNQKIDILQNQIEKDVDIQAILTKQMLQDQFQLFFYYLLSNLNFFFNFYTRQLKIQKTSLEIKITKLTYENQELKDRVDQLYIQIQKYQEELDEIEENKAQEIGYINKDYQDKLSKQNMIIDTLQEQINSFSVSPMVLLSPQNMKYINQQQLQSMGSDSQQSKGSHCKTKEEKQQFLRNIKRMTTMTSGWMSNKQDYTTLGVLSKIDQYKSQQKLESFNKLN